ncbi:aspartate kinase [bacterium]|jgi:aspartate kinase|nr:aspartate kinase [bacterium]
MALIVQKYGGTSLGSPQRIVAVAKRIARLRADGHQAVVVVSAMGQSTDDLIELAHQVSQQPAHREMDMLLTTGERISMALLTMALTDLGVDAISLTGSQSGIITDQSHRRARIKKILGDRIRTALKEDKVVIVAGFQGVSETKEITTLGRGGSDTTAVALASVLSAELCEIYTDVDGVYSTDPRICSDAVLLPRLRSDLMIEMATRGAGVLHPRSVELARQFGVALRVRNSLNETQGTEIVTGSMEEFRIAGVTADPNKFLIRVELMRPTVLSALWDQSGEAHLAVVAPVFLAGIVEFYADRDSETEWKRLLERLSTEGFVNKYSFEMGLIPLSVVGDRFSQDGKALQEIMEVLSNEGVTIQHGQGGPLAVTVAIPATHLNEAVRCLHTKYLGAQQ